MRSVSYLVLLSLFGVVGPSIAVERIESHRLNVFTSVFRLDPPAAGERDYRVLSTVDGKIYKVDETNDSALKVLTVAASTGSNVELSLTPGNTELIESAEILSGSRADAFTLMVWEKNRAADIARENKNRENSGLLVKKLPRH